MMRAQRQRRDLFLGGGPSTLGVTPPVFWDLAGVGDEGCEVSGTGAAPATPGTSQPSLVLHVDRAGAAGSLATSIDAAPTPTYPFLIHFISILYIRTRKLAKSGAAVSPLRPGRRFFPVCSLCSGSGPNWAPPIPPQGPPLALVNPRTEQRGGHGAQGGLLGGPDPTAGPGLRSVAAAAPGCLEAAVFVVACF